MRSSTTRIEQEQHVQETLRRFGLKWTRPRSLIFRVLFQSDNHLSAEEIYEALAKEEPTIAIATVYRTVRLFEDLGLLAGVDLGDGMERYEWIRSQHHHHHLVCSQCQAIEEVPADILKELKETIFREAGFRLDEREVTFTGICSKCILKE